MSEAESKESECRYRVIKDTIDGRAVYFIAEVFDYGDGRFFAYIGESIDFAGFNIDELREKIKELEAALSLPVLVWREDGRYAEEQMANNTTEEK